MAITRRFCLAWRPRIILAQYRNKLFGEYRTHLHSRLRSPPRKATFRNKLIYGPFSSMDRRESHRLPVNRIHRIWSKMTAESAQNLRDAISIARLPPRAAGQTCRGAECICKTDNDDRLASSVIVVRIHKYTCCSKAENEEPRLWNTGAFSGPGVTIVRAVTHT